MNIFIDQPLKEQRPFAMQFLRKIEAAFSEYSIALEELEHLISEHNSKWSRYYRALYHFEASLSQLYQAYANSAKALGEKIFDKDDGSPLDRLNKIYNKSKHQLAESDQPIFITNEGIEIFEEDAKITFEEIETLMRECGRIAMILSDSTIAIDHINQYQQPILINYQLSSRL